MSIETLEEKYEQLRRGITTAGEHLSHCALQASAIQNQMRVILSEVAPGFCGPCEHKCCEGFPLDGWFSFEDYLLFRITYGRPAIPANRVMRDTACSFLTPDGCSLPADMRPFTCVKINCEQLNEVLKCSGKEHRFNLLRKALDAILLEVSRRINGGGQSSVEYAHHDANDAPSINPFAG
jgi:hypothetical protein